jgi:hypothetical protein
MPHTLELLTPEEFVTLSTQAAEVIILLPKTEILAREKNYQGTLDNLKQLRTLIDNYQQDAQATIDFSAGYEEVVAPLQKIKQTLDNGDTLASLWQSIFLIMKSGVKKELVMPTLDKAYNLYFQSIKTQISVSPDSLDIAHEEARPFHLSSGNSAFTKKKTASPDSFETQTTQEAASPQITDGRESMPEKFSPPTVKLTNSNPDSANKKETVSAATHQSAPQIQSAQQHPAFDQAYRATKVLHNYIKKGEYGRAMSCITSINKIVNQRNTGNYSFECTPDEYEKNAKHFLINNKFPDSILNAIHLLLSAPPSDTNKNMKFYQQIIDTCMNDLRLMKIEKEEGKDSEYFFENIYCLQETKPEACLVAALAWRESHGLNFKKATISGGQQKQEHHSGHITMADNLIEQLKQQHIQPHRVRKVMESAKKFTAKCDQAIYQLNNKIHMLPDNSNTQEFYKQVRTAIRDIKKSEYLAENKSSLKSKPKEENKTEPAVKKNKYPENFAQNHHGFYNKPRKKITTHALTQTPVTVK